MNKTLFVFVAIFVLLNVSFVGALQINSNIKTDDFRSIVLDDFDPLVDIVVFFEVLAIRPLDKIDLFSDPDFYLKVFIDGEEFVSPTWHDTIHLYDCWNISKNVDDSKEVVDIRVELWDWDSLRPKRCDISGDINWFDTGFTIDLEYNIKTGLWYGDDYNVGDPSGFGRLCGCDDGSIYKDENDCEVYFNIYQNDFDSDEIPYFVEEYVYKTDPEVSNLGEDLDKDSVPIEWEHRWGFNPLLWEDHRNYDPDDDSLNNTEEFLVAKYGSDPYRRDLFLEMDFMEDENTGKRLSVRDRTFELMKDPFQRRNIVFHIDYDNKQGGDLIPFDNYTETNEMFEIYNNYFIQNEEDRWKRGIFHYAIVVHTRTPSMAFSGDVPPHLGYFRGTNSFIIAYTMVTHFHKKYFEIQDLDFMFATSFVHEMGHNFGLRWGDPFGVDLNRGRFPWQLLYWLTGRYKSIMNYRYVFTILDYSDGSHGFGDYNDWANLDFSHFEYPEEVVVSTNKIN